MSKIKGQGSSKNNHKTAGKRLGIKLHGGQNAYKGQVIVRQVGMTKRAGEGTYMSRNFSIHAARDGQVAFTTQKVKLFTGKSAPRTIVQVVQPAKN